jgi:phage terminase large subunit
MIYSNWDSEINLIDRFKAPTSWMRVWVVDFGYTNPFVWQCWAIDGDGRAYRTAEIYVTRTLVEDVADLIKAWRRENDEPYPQAIVCDHDAEDRATLERHLGMETTPALKDVQGGIHSVMARLRSADDGKPRMFLLRDSLLEKDLNLADEMKPTCTEEEIDGYEWEDQSKKETPRKVNDHGCDCTRYLSMHLDAYSDGWSMGMSG